MARSSSPARSTVLLAMLACGLWLWAFCLLGAKEHDPLSYFVSQSLPPLWGFIGDSLGILAMGLLGAALLFAGLMDLSRGDSPRIQRLSAELLLCGLVPLADVALTAGLELPGAYLVPIAFALLTGRVVGQILGHAPGVARFIPDATFRGSGLAAVWLLASLLGGWWFWQGCQAYDGFLLGFSDFGHFAVRVANTWEGRGFLQQGPDLPIFWDHFNPGLALLAPLWGIWPDAKLFILLQAVCLALPAPLVFGIARRLHFDPRVAFVWAAAYLALPAVGQLNLNYGYGWHPESVALPLLFAAMYALLAGQRMLAAALALVAGSFAEVVIVALGCLAFATLLAILWRRFQGAAEGGEDDPWCSALPAWAWFGAWAVCAVAFVLIHQWTAASRFQEGRFTTLGDNGLEILLSPLLRPHIFWGYVLRPRCLFFLLAVLAPLGIANIRRAGPLALTLLPPLLVLFAWKEASGTSLAFQYTTTLLPLAVLAALLGARRTTKNAPLNSSLPLTSAGAALVAALTLSTFIGALPWSAPTLQVVAARSYPPTQQPGDPRPHRADERAPGSPGNQLLQTLLTQVGTRDAKVLATGRVAAHLLHTTYVETVDNVLVRWEALSQRAGEDRTAVELFDWILLDTLERAHQSPEKVERILAAADVAGFRKIHDEQGIVLLQKPRP